MLEWLGESIDPGEVGGVDGGGRARGGRSRTAVLVCLVIALTALGVAAWMLWRPLDAGAAGRVLPFVIGSTVYLLAGYFIHPEPDMGNVGWLGGMMDNPFRISDDVNRMLMGAWVLLWPARFIAESLVDGVVLVVRARD
jgi:hypothetical protein